MKVVLLQNEIELGHRHAIMQADFYKNKKISQYLITYELTSHRRTSIHKPSWKHTDSYKRQNQ